MLSAAWLIFMCLWMGGPDYRLCILLNPFSPSHKSPKEGKGEKIPDSHLDCFAGFSCFLSGRIEILLVSMAALIQPPSFKVVKLVEGNKYNIQVGPR